MKKLENYIPFSVPDNLPREKNLQDLQIQILIPDKPETCLKSSCTRALPSQHCKWSKTVIPIDARSNVIQLLSGINVPWNERRKSPKTSSTTQPTGAFAEIFTPFAMLKALAINGVSIRIVAS